MVVVVVVVVVVVAVVVVVVVKEALLERKLFSLSPGIAQRRPRLERGVNKRKEKTHILGGGNSNKNNNFEFH